LEARSPAPLTFRSRIAALARAGVLRRDATVYSPHPVLRRMLVSHELTRRDFVTGAGALAAAVLLPAAATARRPPAEGTVVLFQGDSITDGGRNRAASEPNQPGGLGSSYPLLVASAALAAHPD